MKERIMIAAVILAVLMVILTGVVTYNMPESTICPGIPECRPVIQTEYVSVIEEVEVSPDYKQKVVDALLSEAAKDKSLRKCGGRAYDIEEISVKRVYDGFVLAEDNEGEAEISDVKVKLNYDEGDCYKTLTCSLNAEEELSC